MQAGYGWHIDFTGTTATPFREQHKWIFVSQRHFDNAIGLNVITLALCTCQDSGIVSHHCTACMLFTNKCAVDFANTRHQSIGRA